MNPVRRGQNIEKWKVTNITTKVLTISDLLSVPCIDPNQTVDVLFYETKDKVSTSKVLPQLVKWGWVTLIKDGVDGVSSIDGSGVDRALQLQDKLSASGTGGGDTEIKDVVLKNSDYTIQISDEVVLVDASSSTVNITLPSPSLAIDDKFYVKKVDSTTGAVNVLPNDSEAIDGYPLISINSKGTSITVVSDGSNWYII